jgi:hypothetical protein
MISALAPLLFVAALAQTQGALVAGTPVDSGEWSDTAAIVFPDGLVACSGTLIAPDVVLTARHCGEGPVERVALRTNEISAPGELIEVETVWFPKEEALDLALLFLREESSVTPRKMLRNCPDNYLAPDSLAWISGYGATDPEGTQWDGKLRCGTVAIRSESCEDLSIGCHPELSPEHEIVAVGTPTDTCIGDSGGPLLVETEEGKYLVGVTSRGLQGDEFPCGQGGIYTRVDRVIESIEIELGRSFGLQDCQQLEAPLSYSENSEIKPVFIHPRGGCQHAPLASPLAWFLVMALVPLLRS